MYNVRDMGRMLKSMSIHQRDSKRIVKSNFVTSCLAFRGSIPIVRYVKSSPTWFLRFKAYVEEEKISNKSLVCLDISTRWNSTYLMLETIQSFKKAFKRLEEQDPQYVLKFFDDDKNKDPLGNT